MRKFLNTIFWAFLVPLLICVLIFLTTIFLVPTTPRRRLSLYLLGSIQKDSMLKHTASPRIIFVGGSNITQGLNSQIIRDSLKINPINTSITGYLGLVYMMDNTSQYIRNGDIVVLIPEYSQFYNDRAYGSEGEDLTRVVFDVDKSKLRLIHHKQLLNIIPRLPAYFESKLDPSEYNVIPEPKGYYTTPFNKYGDDYKSRTRKRVQFEPLKTMGSKFDAGVFDEIKKFQSEVQKKGGKLFISYPCLQERSFLNCKDQIDTIDQLYIKYMFNIIGKPENYSFPDSLVLDFAFHLNAPGQDRRTIMFIRDFKAKLREQKDNAHRTDIR